MSLYTKYLTFYMALLLVAACLSLSPTLAQDSNTILTIGLEKGVADYIGGEIFDDFEAAHPGVDVIVVDLDEESRHFDNPSDASSVPAFLSGLNNYASQADLLPIEMPYGINPLYTRSGAFLDISPLMNADPNANLEDFYPAILQSLQWEGGTWGLPLSATLDLIAYNKVAFDNAGLDYPDESWTLQDWINAGRMLTTYDAAGKITMPGLYGLNTALLLRAEYGRSVLDPNTFPSQPLLTDPELANLVNTWVSFMRDISPATCCDFDWQALPIQPGGTYMLDSGRLGDDAANWGLTFYPHATAGLYIKGFAVSAGTENPQLAYELLQYLTTSPEISALFLGDVTARESMMAVEAESLAFMHPELSPELQVFINQAIENALPTSEVEAFNSVEQTISILGTQGNTAMSAEEALLRSQENAITILRTIDETAATNPVVLATVEPTPVLDSNEIALKFGVEMTWMPSDEMWDAAVADFVAQDPQVGDININTEYMPLTQRVDEQDCFYLGNNTQGMSRQIDYNPSQIRNIDPYLAADSNFDPNMMTSGTLEALTQDGVVWGLPMSLTPMVLWYESSFFEAAGLEMPENDWTVSQWEDTMHALYDGEYAVFQTQSYGGSYVMMLVNAYGGSPLDYSSTPYQIRADEATVNASRQVLDLAKEGLLDYTPLQDYTYRNMNNNVPMFDSLLMNNDWRLMNREGDAGDPYRVVMFPRGNTYTPINYTLAVAYISAKSPAPDACYRWLSFLSQRPELLDGMPARQADFEASLNYIANNDDIVQLYRDFNAALQSNNVVIVPQAYNNYTSNNIADSMGNQLATIWLYKAFDAYVLEDADLEAGLLQGQSFQRDYAACAANISARSYTEFDNLSAEDYQDYLFQFVECAVAVDPDLRELPLFASYYE